MNNDLISREALKKKLQARHDNGEEDFDKGYNIGIETAIDLIDNAPTVDLVFPTINVNISEETKQKLIEELQKPHKLLVLPEPEVAFERPQGEWIKDNSGNRFCSECGNSALYHEIGVKIESRFCPNCGAYMKGGIDNTPTVAINKDFYKTDKSNPINRSDLFQ